MESVKNLEYFEELANSERPVVLFFTADWCPDCQFIYTFIEEIMERNQEFDFYKVDPDSQQDICEKANVMGIPSFVVYQKGEVVADFIGNNSKTKAEIESFLETAKAKV